MLAHKLLVVHAIYALKISNKVIGNSNIVVCIIRD